ncbi:hypothetical protein MPH_13789 [Macrophomina phaseolina MS6]|uniref:Uncharacterized protein n=1 Tax=Macrophomina phaseolina (strain MS6) TaxID=1126212 RepID=K2R8L2_MACPH|nr:hypothetical protein MPH_13789 [Macrophomina phaseolina MS6]
MSPIIEMATLSNAATLPPWTMRLTSRPSKVVQRAPMTDPANPKKAEISITGRLPHFREAADTTGREQPTTRDSAQCVRHSRVEYFDKKLTVSGGESYVGERPLELFCDDDKAGCEHWCCMPLAQVSNIYQERTDDGGENDDTECNDRGHAELFRRRKIERIVGVVGSGRILDFTSGFRDQACLRLRHKHCICMFPSTVFDFRIQLLFRPFSTATVKKSRARHLQLPKMPVFQDVEEPHADSESQEEVW